VTGPERIVRARAPITCDTVADRAGVGDDPGLASTAEDLFSLQADRARLHARYMRRLEPLWAGRDAQDADLEAGEVEDLVAAMGLRTTKGRAYRLIADAHRAVMFFPRVLALLARGLITVEGFEQVLRRSRRLTEQEQSRVDEHVATWDMGLPGETFTRALGQLCAYVHEVEDRAAEAEHFRQITVRAPREDDGIATIEISGPAPEILAFGTRLDETARAVCRAQRRALQQRLEGDPEASIPFDDGTVASTGMPMARGLVRYLLATRADWTLQDVPVPKPRFRLNVTVPAMTLLGASDAPGMLDGLQPLPADMARHLAGDCEDWYRVLTDPASGVFLPLPADRYTPSASMVEHLRLRNPVCAVPGCDRSTEVASEVDHIIEYDHQCPADGGHTEIGNLHILCRHHHQMKTAGLLDPIRLTDPADPPPGTSAPTDGPMAATPGGSSVPVGGVPPGTTRWVFGAGGTDQVDLDQADEADLIGEFEAAALQFMWERYLRHEPTPPTAPGTGLADPAPNTDDPTPNTGDPTLGTFDPDDPPPF
jgi:hypothetical protein